MRTEDVVTGQVKASATNWETSFSGYHVLPVSPTQAVIESRRMIEFSISTSSIRTDLERLDRLLELGSFHKLEIGFYDEETLPLVMDFALGRDLTYGFHDPLPRLPSDDFPFLTDPDEEKRWRTLDSMYRTMQTAVRYRAEYVIGHIPSVIWEPQPMLSEDKIVELAHNSCDLLSGWSQESGIPFVLENVGPNPYFFEFEAFVEVMEAHPRLEFCLDVGHLHLMSVYSGFDSLEFSTALAPYTTILHVYNATPEMYRKYHHVPVHPSQLPEEGWADVVAIVECVLARTNNDLTIVFEHSPQYPASDGFIQEGIESVRQAVEATGATCQG